MNVLITGLSGSVAPKVAEHVRGAGATVLGWDRAAISPDDAAGVQAHLHTIEPGAIIHLAMGSEAWAAGLARYGGERGLPFVFTSTVMVFDHQPDGPYTPASARTAQEEYGRYKIRCEDAILAANPDAMVARIGWQIDREVHGNNMLAHLDAQQARDGHIEASRNWIPACSFMADTAAALWKLIETPAGGVYHLDSNAMDAWTFDRVVRSLQVLCGRADWQVTGTDAYQHDQRLLGHEGLMPRLSERLEPVI